MPSRQPTKNGTPRLSEVARHVVVPSGVVTTGWPAVRDKCAEFGVTFDAWQDGAGKIILAKRRTGIYAASIGGVVISIPRQVGKTFLIGAIVFALCLLNPKMTVIWTAHQLRTAAETFAKMQGFARRARVWPHVKRIVLGSGDEAVLFNNGSRILFGARERGFGLGFDEVDVLVFDEAQRVTDKSLEDMVPATNQSRQPAGALLLFMGTPPRPTDTGDAFPRKRAEALSGEDEDTAYIEFSADQDADPNDWAQVAKANPSFPVRTPREAILRMKKNLGPDSFMREGLGIWDQGSILPGWASCKVDAKEPPKVVALGVGVSFDEEWGSLAACGFWPDGKPNLGAVDRRPSSDWIPAEAKRIQGKHRCAVVIDEKCPDKSLIRALKDEGVELTVVKLEENVEACSELRNRVKTRQITHLNTPWLNDAITAAAWRYVSDRRVIGRKQSTGHVEMLEAAVMALHGAIRALAYDVMESFL